MGDVAGQQRYVEMMAGSGKLLAADGTIVDVATLLRNLVAVMGGDTGAGGDIEAIRLLAIAALAQLELIEANTDALETINTGIAASNTAIQTAVQLIDNMIGAIGAAHGTGVTILGAKAEGTVPTAVTDGQAVALYADLFGRLVTLYTDLAQSAASVSDIAPAQMAVARWLDWPALTAPDAVTPEANVQDYENITVQFIVATIDTSVGLIVWASVDNGTTWFVAWSGTVLASDLQTNAVTFTGKKYGRIKCEFDAEAGGVAAVVTFKAMAGN